MPTAELLKPASLTAQGRRWLKGIPQTIGDNLAAELRGNPRFRVLSDAREVISEPDADEDAAAVGKPKSPRTIIKMTREEKAPKKTETETQGEQPKSNIRIKKAVPQPGAPLGDKLPDPVVKDGAGTTGDPDPTKANAVVV